MQIISSELSFKRKLETGADPASKVWGTISVVFGSRITDSLL